uniref:Uncharacterized protein n=1 Tax=Monopterus albus TaxID=43700 RepID=A0A3Q3R6X6_MONAL
FNVLLMQLVIFEVCSSVLLPAMSHDSDSSWDDTVHDFTSQCMQKGQGNIHDCFDIPSHQLPLLQSTSPYGEITQTYTPFSLQDMSMVKCQLPDIAKGGALWIKVFLGACAGCLAAIGDFHRDFTLKGNDIYLSVWIRFPNG